MAGPFVKETGGANSTTDVYDKKTWYTQPKPYKKPLEYHHSHAVELKLPRAPGFDGFGTQSYIPTFSGIPPYVSNGAFNKCSASFYSSLQAAASETAAASVGVSLAERKQAVKMIAERAATLASFVRSVRKGDFRKAAKVLGYSRKKDVPKGVSRAKHWSNNFLEYHFGWVPLIKDIHSAAEVLQGPPPSRMARGSGSGFYEDIVGGYPKYPKYGQQAWRRQYVYKVKAGARFTIMNPDLHLANRLGLTNPFVVAWELVPFSFVVDWFVPVGDFLNGMTATLGVQVDDAWNSFKIEHTYHHLSVDYLNRPIPRMGFGYRYDRYKGAISPYPKMRPSGAFSPTRAAVSMALLIQSLKVK